MKRALNYARPNSPSNQLANQVTTPMAMAATNAPVKPLTVIPLTKRAPSISTRAAMIRLTSAPKKPPPMLIPEEERYRLVEALGADLVIAEPFTKEFAEVSAEDWLEQYVCRPLHPIHIVVGFNFSYGKQRHGNPDRLIEAGKARGFSVEVVQPVIKDGEVVSSSAIRKLLSEGQVERAASFLGRPFELSGVVVKGDQRGRTIGVPTANLEWKGELLPKYGVYASKAHLSDGREVSAVTNIGKRPTFAGLQTTVESHLLDFDEDLYGQKISVALLLRIRDEKKFTSVDELVAQIREDIESARTFFGT